ncbi:NAD-dependent epimerase/dehydratase family protein [Brevibacillus sp. SYSU BS000544]|uniref:NAD-dependent epimerase/dehydratase family protein n=1 Tax=Brevibacillus sp. SYSU BS000544 TaxID=3416443 RepID=UPI003CE58493
MKQRCLVTGGSGFIGSHLAERLQQLGHTVTVLDNYSRGQRSYWDQKRDGITYLEGSILDEQLIGRLVPSHDVVFHLAAILGVKTTVTQPLEMMENNLFGTLNILKHAMPQQTKVIFASTSEVYGKGTPPFSEESDRLYGPTSKMRWSYAVEKTFEETLCLGHGLRGLPVTILRYFNVYGPRAKVGPYGGVIPRFIQAALEGAPIQVYGDGTQTRSFTYISDAVEATIAAMSAKANQEIINIGSTHEISIAKLASIIKENTATTSPIKNVPFEDVYPIGFEEIPNRVPDLVKAKKLLGYDPKVSLMEGIRLTIEWFQNDILSRAE